MNRAELKKQAKQSLKGRWGSAIAMILLYNLITSAISFLVSGIPLIGSIAFLILAIPLSFGFTGQFLKFSRNEKFEYFDFFSIGIKNLGKSWSITGHVFLKMLLYIIGYIVCIFAFVMIFLAAVVEDSSTFFTIGGIIVGIVWFVLTILLTMKSYFYILTSYIGNENLQMTNKEIVNKSKELMNGHRWEYFVLNLSFIGWALLSILTCGIGFLWLQPYMEMTNIKFYESLANNGINTDVIKEN